MLVKILQEEEANAIIETKIGQSQGVQEMAKNIQSKKLQRYDENFIFDKENHLNHFQNKIKNQNMINKIHEK